MNYSEVILLFDELGTPTFGENREVDSFLGIGVTYETYLEEKMFEECAQVMGLRNKRALKNSDISPSRALKIAHTISKFPISIFATEIDLSNNELYKTALEYEKFGNIARQRYRSARHRPCSQILHAKVLDHCLFESIFYFIELFRRPYKFFPFIDNWSISESDLDIALKTRSQFIEQRVNEIYAEVEPNLRIRVLPIELLIEDSSRKRFIDVVTTVTGRAFLRKSNVRYSTEPITYLINSLVNRFRLDDITHDEIKLMHHVMQLHQDMIY